MVALREALLLAVSDYACRVMTNADAPDNLIQRTIRSIPGAGNGVNTLEAARDGFRDLVCDPLRPQAPNPNDNFPVATPPSGLCPAPYCVYVRIQATVASSGAPFDNGPNDGTMGQCTFQGPLGEPFIAPGGGGLPNVFVEDANGVLINAGNVNGLTNITLTPDHRRPDNSPDVCPEVPVPPAPLPSTTVDVTYDDADNLPVTIPVDIEIQDPIIDVDNNFIIPMLLIAPTFELNVDFNVNLGVGVATFGGDNSGSDNCCPPIEEPDEDPEENEDDPPPPEDDRRFAGVYVNCLIDPAQLTATERGNGSGPSFFVPKLAEIRFAQIVGGRRAWSAEQPIKTESQFVWVEGPAVGYGWDVIDEAGVTATVEPLYITNE